MRKATMSMFRVIWGALVVLCTVTTMASNPAFAQQGQKPNIVFIMGDDIGWMQPSRATTRTQSTLLPKLHSAPTGLEYLSELT